MQISNQFWAVDPKHCRVSQAPGTATRSIQRRHGRLYAAVPLHACFSFQAPLDVYNAMDYFAANAAAATPRRVATGRCTCAHIRACRITRSRAAFYAHRARAALRAHARLHTAPHLPSPTPRTLRYCLHLSPLRRTLRAPPPLAAAPRRCTTHCTHIATTSMFSPPSSPSLLPLAAPPTLYTRTNRTRAFLSPRLLHLRAYRCRYIAYTCAAPLTYALTTPSP